MQLLAISAVRSTALPIILYGRYKTSLLSERRLFVF